MAHRLQSSGGGGGKAARKRRRASAGAVASASEAVVDSEPRFVWAKHPDVRGRDHFKHWWPAVREKRAVRADRAKRARRSSLSLSQRRNRSENTVVVRWFFPGQGSGDGQVGSAPGPSPSFCERSGVRASFEKVAMQDVQPFLDAPAPGALGAIFGGQAEGQPLPSLRTLQQRVVGAVAVDGGGEARQGKSPTAASKSRTSGLSPSPFASSPLHAQRITLALPTTLFGSAEEYAEVLTRSFAMALRAAGRDVPFEESGGSFGSDLAKEGVAGEKENVHAGPGPSQSQAGHVHSQSEEISRLASHGSSALSQLPSTPAESLATSLSVPLPWNDSQAAEDGEREKGKPSSAGTRDQGSYGDREKETERERHARSPLLRELSEAGETPREGIRLEGRYELVSSCTLSDNTSSGKAAGRRGGGKGGEHGEEEVEEEFFVRWAGEWGFASDFAGGGGLRSRFEFRCAIPAARAREVMRQRGGWTLYR